MILLRQTSGEQIGRFHKPGPELEVQIQGSIQPTGPRTRKLFPEGTINSNSTTLFIFGSVDIELGDIVLADNGIKYKITALEDDWADLGNYRKYLAEKVKE